MGLLSPLRASAQSNVDTHLLPDLLKPTGYYETCPRQIVGGNISAVLTSGKLRLQAIVLPGGFTATNITWLGADTGATNPTAWWFALYSGPASAPVLLRQTADQTTTAWGGNALKTVALSSSYVVPSTGIYYVGIMMAAATPPNLVAIQHRSNSALGLTPLLEGNTSDVGLTTTAPPTAGALASGPNVICWAAVS